MIIKLMAGIIGWDWADAMDLSNVLIVIDG